jgi:hypothetical protein
MKTTPEVKINKFNVSEISLILKLNNNSRLALLHKYGEIKLSESDWKIKFKKEGLNF